MDEVRRLRNRIAPHEPLISRDPESDDELPLERADKTARSYRAAISLAATLIWIRSGLVKTP